ncbi:MAG: hypothetical protein IJH50_07315 [Kiritimatiellae bacterium]|nr:hypothetical protein [Kiritimatiellia bacterium]
MTFAFAVPLLLAAATGFHSAVETPDGWAFRDGDGRLWRARAVEKANGYGPDCGAIGRPYADALKAEGLSRDDWCARTARRLKEWGFNALGTACDSRINASGDFATTEMIALSSWMRDRGADHVIDINPSSPCGAVANAFHPDFAAVCDAAAAKCCAPRRDERKFLGYFLDNERNWWGLGNWWDCGLLDAAVEKLPPAHPARTAAERILAEIPSARVPDRAAARRIYTEELAERYFSVIAAAIRRYDPNHMILGCRFAGVAGAPNAVWRACGRHCDVVSLNCYPTADLGKGKLILPVIAGFLPPGVAKTSEWTPVPLETMLRARHEVCRRPLFISEWSFRGGDVGRPRTESNGQQLATQGERAKAAAMFLEEMERLPYVLGHSFYMWTDERFPAAAGGVPETLNWGLVALDDAPHEEMTAAFRAAPARFGFHRVVRNGGKWSLRDPAGRPWKVLAIEKANMNGPVCEARGGIHPYGDALKTAGITREEWTDRTAARLRDWGFNMLGTGCDSWLKRHGFAYAEMLAFGARVTCGDSAWCIRPWKGRCAEQFPDVFHPKFAETCEEVASRNCARMRGETSFLGYYLDNELSWWGEGDWYRCGMLDYILKHLPEGRAAHAAAMKCIARHGYENAAAYLAEPEAVRDPVRRHFTRVMADEYFRITCGAIRRHDPNHLILGCRFAGIHGAPDEVWAAAGKYCDIVSFNCYPTADVTNGVLTVNFHSRPIGAKNGTVARRNAEPVFARLYEVSGKPLFVTEWSFMASDAGLPCTKVTGHVLPTQADRARAVSLFLDFVNTRPYMIGSEYFMWTDEPPEGVTFASPENGNYGLVDVRDTPYREVTDAFRRAKEKGIQK